MTNRTLSRGVVVGVVAAAGLAVAAAARLSAPAEAMPAPTPAPAPAPAASCCDDPAPQPAPALRKRVLHISADPNNLPFTNDRREGFENKIADVIAAELGMEIEYHWRAQRRGFFRQSLKEYEADLVLGVPVGFDLATTTAPYYRSTYVFVTKAAGGPKVASLDDPALKSLRIGVQMIGNDKANTPPAHALAARGLIGNVTGFMIYGDYREPNPPARVIDAVAKGEVDVSIAWGPMAGYFAKRSKVPLTVTPVTPAVDPSGLPMTFGISLGVRRGNTALRDTLDAILKKRKPDIDRILDGYGVPRVAKPQPKPDK